MDNTDNLTCIICSTKFASIRLYNIHRRDDDACSVFYKLEAITPKQCQNTGCNTCSGNKSDRKKHFEYRCHLCNDGELICKINNDGAVTLNRTIFEHHGRPNKNMMMAKGGILHNAANLTWKCQICLKTKGKYDWIRIINRVNSKRKIIAKIPKSQKGPGYSKRTTNR